MRKISWYTLSSFNLIKVVYILVFIALLVIIPVLAVADIIDPETYIQKNGYQSQRTGDDGKTPFYNFTERTNISRITKLEKDIVALPKNQNVFKTCEFIRGGTKAKLVESTGKAYDIAVSSYGHKGSTIACVLKYMYGGEVGTQLIYIKKSHKAMFLVFVTH